MFNLLKNHFNKKNLKDENYLYLFDKSNDDEYVCFDIETTGRSIQDDDIIYIAAVIIKGKEVLTSKKFIKLVKPKTKLQIDAIKKHHIRQMDLEEADDIDVVLEEFLEFVGNRKLVGYYLDFNLEMLNKYLKPKLGITLPNESYDVSSLYHKYWIKKVRQTNIDLTFGTIAKNLQIPTIGKFNAYNNAIMSAMMFIKLQNKK